MTLDEAARILEVAPDATPEQLEARFNDLRHRLEEKVAKAPTPGLQTKYRESLAKVTAAFETLTLASDASSLPMVQRAQTIKPASAPSNPVTPGATANASSAGSASTRMSKKKSNSEILLMAGIVAVVLGGGGWWAVKHRSDVGEKTRGEAMAKQAAENEKAAAVKKGEDEKARLEKLGPQLRSQLAEIRINWDAHENEARDLERKTSELKADLRSLRDLEPAAKAELFANANAHESYTSWLKNHLLRHPAKLARARAEEFLGARSIDEAATAMAELRTAMAKLETEIADNKRALLATTGTLRINSEPAGLAWELRDAYGRVTSGKTPAELPAVPVGGAGVRLSRAGWPDVTRQVAMKGAESTVVAAEFASGSVNLSTDPAGVAWEIQNRRGFAAKGVTPAQLGDVPVGSARVAFRRDGWPTVERELTVRPGERVAANAEFKAAPVELTSNPAGATIWADGRQVGVTPLTLPSRPGRIAYEARLDGYLNEPREIVVEAGSQVQRMEFMLRKKPPGLARPDFTKGPKQFRVTTNVRTAMAMEGVPESSRRFETNQVDEVVLSQPTDAGEWQRAIQRIVSIRSSVKGENALPDTTLEFESLRGASWRAKLVKGGYADAQRNFILLLSPVPAAPSVWLADPRFWPREATPLGSSWPIDVSTVIGTWMISRESTAGTATGKIIALQQTEAEQWAEVEFNYDSRSDSHQFHGKAVFRIDLAAHYVTSVRISSKAVGDYGNESDIEISAAPLGTNAVAPAGPPKGTRVDLTTPLPTPRASPKSTRPK